jgi:DTW domain-containing protein YfiP
VPVVATRTRVVIVRHHLEIWRASNTGRLAHLALPNSEIVDYGGERALALPPLDGAWLLWPDGDAPVGAPAPKQLVVLDASWSQARRMYRKLSALRGLPVLRLPDAPMPTARMRESPGPGRVSTIEAIARALRVIEGEAIAKPLETLFSVAVERLSS